MTESAFMAVLFFAAAALYASVGHGGASAYLAVMAFFGLAPEVMRPTALVLNVFVASIGTFRYYRAGWFSCRLFVPAAAGALPTVLLGARLELPAVIFNLLIGVMLIFAAARLVLPQLQGSGGEPPRPLWLAAIAAAIGLVAGLTGTGGGIFLSPVLILMGWASAQAACGVAAPFILANSLVGLAANPAAWGQLSASMPLWILAVVGGGLIGTQWSRTRATTAPLLRALAVVLVIAAAKLILTAVLPASRPASDVAPAASAGQVSAEQDTITEACRGVTSGRLGSSAEGSCYSG